MNVNNFFNKAQKEMILQAIRDAEMDTSGEIRLHLESSSKGNALERAVKVFEKLKMHETRLRNGTIVYLAIKDKTFAIFGDEGINEVVPENFWEDVKEEMQGFFKEEKFAEGIDAGIRQIGQKLKEFFPYQDDDVNELPDEISTGE